ncbi:hypothetical protein V5O48_001844 [Marasmius crinis-equi]|uniref:F-box domain-containing protein n=1 Tax=Marasmius crinis-equi TaxID=585013 RepID=A0ABR3FXV7_9AGAR
MPNRIVLRVQDALAVVTSLAPVLRGSGGGSVQRKALETARHHNALQPINLLPDEILAAIFVAFRGTNVRTRPQSILHEHPFVLLVITRVCHRWRRVATNCSVLWSEPVLCCPSLTQLMLERSRFAPIHLTIVHPSFIPLDRDLVLDQFPRLGSLSCEMGGELSFLSQILSKLGTSNAPSLTSVSIEYRDNSPPPFETVVDWSKLDLGWCHNLRKLSLKIDTPVEAERLVALLSLSSKLKDLSLTCVVIPPSLRAPPSEILLSQLERFTANDLYGDNTLMRYILGQLRVPPSAVVHLNFTQLCAATARSLGSFLAHHAITSLSCLIADTDTVKLDVEPDSGCLRVFFGLRWAEITPLLLPLFSHCLMSLSCTVISNENPGPLGYTNNVFDFLANQCPCLTTLELHSWEPKPLHVLQKRGPQWLARSELVRLSELLQSRQMLGTPIQDLTLTESTVSQTACDILRALVPHFRLLETDVVHDTRTSCVLCGRQPCGDVYREIAQVLNGPDGAGLSFVDLEGWSSALQFSIVISNARTQIDPSGNSHGPFA